jgi:hypothetical protein
MRCFKKVVLLICLIFNLQSYALETVDFCLNERGHLDQAKSYLSDILLADEFIDIRRSVNCLEVGVRPYRKDLLSNYLRRRFKFRVATSQGGQISTVSSVNDLRKKNKMCRLKFEQIIHRKKETTDYKLGKRSRANISNRLKDSKMESQLLLSSGIAGMIKINDQPLVVTCFVINSSQYRLQFSLGDKILSSLILTKGQRVNVGSVVGGGSGGGSGVRGLSIYKNKNHDSSTTDYFLSILN